MNESFVEEKTCRICGAVDLRNVNIFDTRWRNLLYKILTIFPLTIYETDPLPKNICKRCVEKVNLIYNEYVSLSKCQKKWVDNVRQNQPEHQYVYILDLVEQTTRDMVKKIRSVAPEYQFGLVRPILASGPFGSMEFATDPVSKEDLSLMFPADILEKPLSSQETIKNSQNALDKLANKTSLTIKLNSVNVKHKNISELKHKLQSNGCTLMTINNASGNGVSKLAAPQQTVSSPTDHSSSASRPQGKRNFSKTPTVPTNASRCLVQCALCQKRFPNQQFLSKHSLKHLRISDRRLFDLKFLNKKVRRGRIIPIDDKKWIRCLNCAKLFTDNRAILEHWSKGDCEFYCNICGQEFAQNPKNLREHVQNVHGISYKSSKRRNPMEQKADQLVVRDMFGKSTIPYDPAINANSVKIKKESSGKKNSSTSNSSFLLNTSSVSRASNPPERPLTLRLQRRLLTSMIDEKGRVCCTLCGLSFPNFQSKNSHMRKHKNENQSMVGTAPETTKSCCGKRKRALPASSTLLANSTLQLESTETKVSKIKLEPIDPDDTDTEVEVWVNEDSNIALSSIDSTSTPHLTSEEVICNNSALPEVIGIKQEKTTTEREKDSAVSSPKSNEFVWIEDDIADEGDEPLLSNTCNDVTSSTEINEMAVNQNLSATSLEAVRKPEEDLPKSISPSGVSLTVTETPSQPALPIRPNIRIKNTPKNQHRAEILAASKERQAISPLKIALEKTPIKNFEATEVVDATASSSVVTHMDSRRPEATLTPPIGTSGHKTRSQIHQQKPNEDHFDYGKVYNCHPCGRKFSLKTELFEHKKQCQSNNKFSCRFCLRAFVTSADLQMHIMLMHKGK